MGAKKAGGKGSVTRSGGEAAPAKPKKKRDWRALTAAHRRRGELLAMYMLGEPIPTEELPELKKVTAGRPQVHSDKTVEALLTLKVLLRLSLRAIEGLAQNLTVITRQGLSTPDYSTLSRREAALSIDIGARLNSDERHVLVVDSTGLKVFGEGEWKVKIHGTNIHRTWRKVHLLVDRETGHIIDVKTTDNRAGDAPTFTAMLPEQLNGSVVLGDGAYHTKNLHREIHQRGGTLLSPPPKNAKRWGRQTRIKEEPAFIFRNKQLTILKRRGRRRWKIESGCGQRSFVESTNHRLKAITGDRLSARTMDRQVVEVRLRCKALNRLAISSGNLVPPADAPAQKPRTVRQLIRANALAA
jgi:hypothetical protein